MVCFRKEHRLFRSLVYLTQTISNHLLSALHCRRHRPFMSEMAQIGFSGLLVDCPSASMSRLLIGFFWILPATAKYLLLFSE